MGRPMTRKQASHGARPRSVYDHHADEITKPDIVPAAVPFARKRDDLSIILERCEQEIFAQSDWRELRRRDEATVVDGPLGRPSGPATRAPSQHETSDAPVLPRSGPRHRAPLATPPSGVIQSEKRHQRRERVRAVPASSPVQRRNKNPARVILMVLLTAVAAAGIGTSLADGVLKHVVERIASNFTATNGAHEPLPLPTSAPKSAPTSAVTPRQSAQPTSSNEASEVPVMRLEDLPQSKQDELEAKTKAKTKTRRAVGKLRRRSAP